MRHAKRVPLRRYESVEVRPVVEDPLAVGDAGE
ncbi:MAG: hypothetical protein M3071_24310 [Actinomycetota bacterium]|nr:hypothetical protein [Actinomycetota bacterium]